jgi:hypothetical protein
MAPGLTVAQRLLFLDSTAYMLMAGPILLFMVIPLVYVLVPGHPSPLLLRNMWEFCIVFGAMFLSHATTLWWLHRIGAVSHTLEWWRNTQAVVSAGSVGLWAC